MFGSKKTKTLRNQTDIVFRSRFLSGLSPVERYEFLQLCHRRTYNAGEYIYYQGDPGTGMYFIEEGKIQLIVETEEAGDESEEMEKPTFTIKSPESFGALSIGYELRRMSSAKCLTSCTLLGFFKPDFETLRDREPKIAVKFLEVLSMIAMKQLEKTTNALIEESSLAKAYSLQFDTYYTAEMEEPEL